jgi:hypothetical protein
MRAPSAPGGLTDTSNIAIASGRLFLGTISPTAAHPIWCIEEPSPINTEPPIRVLIFLPSALIKFPKRENKFPTIKTFRLPKISPSWPTRGEVVEVATRDATITQT